MPLVSQHINASPDVVFEVFADLANAEDRLSSIKKIELLTDGPIGPGTRWRETRIVFKREATEEMEIVDFVPGERYSVVCETCGCKYDSEFRFTPDAGGTTVELDLVSTPITTFAKIMSPIGKVMMGPMMRKCMGKDMDELRAHIEGDRTAVTV